MENVEVFFDTSDTYNGKWSSARYQNLVNFIVSEADKVNAKNITVSDEMAAELDLSGALHYLDESEISMHMPLIIGTLSGYTVEIDPCQDDKTKIVLGL